MKIMTGCLPVYVVLVLADLGLFAATQGFECDGSVEVFYTPSDGDTRCAAFSKDVVVRTDEGEIVSVREALVEQAWAAYTFFPNIDYRDGIQGLIQDGVLEHVSETGAFMSAEIESYLKQLEACLGDSQCVGAFPRIEKITTVDVSQHIYSKGKTRQWAIIPALPLLTWERDTVYIHFPGGRFALQGVSCERTRIPELAEDNILRVRRLIARSEKMRDCVCDSSLSDEVRHSMACAERDPATRAEILRACGCKYCRPGMPPRTVGEILLARLTPRP